MWLRVAVSRARKYAADEEDASLLASLHKQMHHGSPGPESYIVPAHQGPRSIGTDVVREVRRSGGAEALQHPGGHAVRGAAVVRSALPSCSHAVGPRPVFRTTREQSHQTPGFRQCLLQTDASAIHTDASASHVYAAVCSHYSQGEPTAACSL